MSLSAEQCYPNDLKFSDKPIRANSADPDQTAPNGQSDQGLHCLTFSAVLLDKFRYENTFLFEFYYPYTILWKPPFCKLSCSKTPTYKSDIVILLHSKSLKKCHKNFGNRFINKNLMPKNDLDLVFYMCKGGNPKFLNLEF